MDIQLFEKAARAMVGRSVRVRLRRPIISDFDGQAYDHKGRAVVDIAPGHTEDKTLYILCHELGHIASKTAADLDPDQKPGSYTLSRLGQWARSAQPATLAQEAEADRRAAQWLRYAEDHAAAYPGDWLEARLRALAGWVPLTLKARVLRYARRGAAQAIKDYQTRSKA